MNQDFEEYLDCLGFEPQTVQSSSEKAASLSGIAMDLNQNPVLQNPDLGSVPPWLFVLDHESQSRPQALELFEKMLEALKLNSQNFQTKFVRDSSELMPLLETHRGFDVCVVMGLKIHPTETILRVFTTNSPAECLLDANLKRPVWQTLQLAQSSLP